MLDMYIPERYLRLPMLKRNRIDKKNVIKIFIDCLIPFINFKFNLNSKL